jgi:hypothetical protein
MRAAKLWLITFFAGFAVVCGLLITTLFTPIPYGDLSRLGRVSENEFGWRKAPPQVAPALLNGSPIDQADILVVGDSFSMTHRWQSVLVGAGYKVTTTFWGQYGETLCDDFDQWIRDSGFRGKLVILESVERLVNERLTKSSSCTKMTKSFDAKAAPFLEPLEHLPLFKLNTAAPLTTGWATYWNTHRAIKAEGDVSADYRTSARHVADGCKYFSNRLCTKALFFHEDDENGPLNAEHVKQMRAFSDKQKATPMLWMIIPNKTTVYIDQANSADFVSALRRESLGPDLFEFAQQERGRIMDFYFPNDTHLSMFGQLALGARILPDVQKLAPLPSAKSP